MTASCGGLYSGEFLITYSGSRAAVVQFNRVITVAYYHESIRTFATCPGIIITGLMLQEVWKSFLKEYFTPMERLVDTVMKLIDGGDIEHAKGVKKTREEDWGLTVEVTSDNFYFRNGVEFCDEHMEAMMAQTSMAKHLARIEGGKKVCVDVTMNGT
jgi:NAD(P)-dependent dehydrogenase (short-subunit alcohol dehydrogenase family)